MFDDPKNTDGNLSASNDQGGDALKWAGVVLTAVGILVGIGSRAKARKEAEKEKKEAAEILASYSGNNAMTLTEAKNKSSVLTNEQRTLLQKLIAHIEANDRNRWRDELKEYRTKLANEDFETKIENLIHKGFFGNQATRRIVEESRTYSDKFNANAIALRAINVTIDNKIERGETDSSTERTVVSTTSTNKSWSTILSDFWTKGEIEENHLNIIRVGLGLVALLLIVKFRKKRRKKK